MTPARVWLTLALLVLGGTLAYLHLRTQLTIGREAHDRFSRLLRELERSDRRQDVAILKYRNGLDYDFDALVAGIEHQHRVQQALRELLPSIGEPSAGETDEVVSSLAHRIGRKGILIERLKTDLAVLRNSTRYLPEAVSDLGPIDARLAEQVDRLFDGLKELGGSGDGAMIRDRALDAVRAIEALAVDRSEDAHRRIRTVTDHAVVIVRRSASVDETIIRLLSSPLTPTIERVLAAHGRNYTAAERQTDAFRALLVALAAFLGLGALLAVARLRRTALALRESNETLESRVGERTAELTETNERLERQIEERRIIERELVRARDAALAATAAKSTFLANMSHELRTPLVAIIGYSELLTEAAEASSHSSVSDLKRIHSAGRHLLELINGLLDLSKIEAGRMTLCLEDLDIAAMIEDIAMMSRPLVDQKGNRLSVSCPGGIGTMRADITKVRQILYNLVSNASKFTEDGYITLAVEGDREHCIFRVIDTGIGMTEEELSRVFEAFAQADASTTRRFGGTGLGLTITSEFCELMGGQVRAKSEPGSGSTFTVTLPRIVPDLVEAPAQEPELALV